MREVSCKVFEILLDPLAAKQVSLEQIVADTGVTTAQLRNGKARIDWDQYVAIMRNVRPHFSDEEYREIGRSYMRSPGLRFAFVIARLLFSPMDIYRWFSKPKQGVGNQMFTCIEPDHQELSPTEIVLSLTLPPSFEVCWDFFLIASGNMEELPCLFGLARAKLALVRLPNGARMEIEIPVGRPPLFARIWRWLTHPFAGRAAARELKEAHESLVDRYAELEVARNTLDVQAEHLRTAQAINDLVQRDLEIPRSLEAVVRALVSAAGFKFAELQVVGLDDETRTVARFGDRDDAPLVQRILTGQTGEEIGTVSVALMPGSLITERKELLELIAPPLTLGLVNALYRRGLEGLVARRTQELRAAHDDLASTVAQLREAQGARQRFFANISHEIRTPLSIIMLAAADIEARAGTLLDPRARSGLTAVTDSARKLVRLVDELLLLAAGQEGKLAVRPEPTQLDALIASVAAGWRPMAEAAGVELTVATVPPSIAMVDPVALERVVTNLLSNAVKYTPRGGAVTLEVAREVDAVQISVFDTGPGIDDDLATRLFGRFERAEGAGRRIAGTGLGLSLAKQLCEAHGGTIAAIRRPTGGTEMRVRLPNPGELETAVVVPRPPATVASTVPRSLEPASVVAPHGLSSATILLAEDDVALAEMIARVLGEDYTVVVAHDGLAALELVKAHQPQLLVTDVDMPGMDGIELSRRFREATNDQLAPIIILSALLDLGTRVAGLDAGATDYVTKPFDPKELLARVRAQLRMRELAVRLHRAEQLSSLGVLTSGLAHELRNPANGVVNAIAPLRRLLPAEVLVPDHPVAQLLSVVGECAEQIGMLSRQLLGFRTGTITLELRSILASELVQRAISLSHAALGQVTVRSSLAIDQPIRCAPPLLIQVLTNLLENAAHAAGRGGWIEVRGRTTGDHAIFELADSGPGVPRALHERVFEPFFTTKPPGVGTGLGLSVSRDIVHRHGGTLEIQERDQRSVFVLQLPMHSELDGAVARV